MLQEEEICSECKDAPVCAICLDCLDCPKWYCNLCCKTHIRNNPEHKACLTASQVPPSTKKTVCGKCMKIAARFCKICRQLTCLSCFHKHDEKYMIRIFPVHVHAKSTSDETEDVKYDINPVKNKENISFKSDGKYQVRIYGIGYLEDGTLIALDGNHQMLIMFAPNGIQREKAFEDEPFAITTITQNEIAITFPYKHEIRFYTVHLEDTECVQFKNRFSTNSIKTPKYKPFSIEYNQGWLAVEVGEREEGKIVIIDYLTRDILYTISCESAHFTGHTIRLTLDQKERLLYISALGKRMVFCMNFKGEILWNIFNASPRSILLLEDSKLGKIIIFSSKKCNAIYELNEQSHKDVVISRRIDSPRYMAFNSNDKTLCIHVTNKENEESLAFYDLKKLHEDISLETECFPTK
ncbi:Hypothetical predicted protein [Mytilus galloprovincialis]|uniref:B box-type domain-containing protein n=1 Tax=Mytilus galloprovincialis TaxID=29158 RepID=A0A8B6DCV5_MYTGA|nr:Hypothetical predicted protein [Mytilus galloprovincialis]